MEINSNMYFFLTLTLSLMIGYKNLVELSHLFVPDQMFISANIKDIENKLVINYKI